MKTLTWRVRLTYGRMDFYMNESAITEQGAIDAALRYARALGYSGQPTQIHSWRIL